MDENPHLSPKKAIKLLQFEESDIEYKIRQKFDAERNTHFGDVQEFYLSTYNILWRCFGRDHRVVVNFQNIIGYKYDSQYHRLQALLGAIRSAKKEIQNAIDHPDEMKIFYTLKGERQNSQGPDLTNNRKIFVVHGRNDTKKIELQDFLKKIGTEPIILEDQSIIGKTVLDQFEYYANSCSFAIILMTGDDFGGLYDYSLQNIFSTSNEDEMKHNLQNHQYIETRARQNVITELGYFWGRLGLERLRILYEEGVAKPSDIDAVMFIKLDDKGSWKYKIARELDCKGIKIDMSLLDPLPD